MTEYVDTNDALSEDSPFWDRLMIVGRLAWPERPEAAPTRRMKDALERMKRAVPFDAATVYFYDPSKKQLVEGVSIDGQVEMIDFLNIGAGAGLSGWTVQERRPLLLSRHEARQADGPGPQYQTFLSVPILYGERIYGALNIGCLSADALGTVDVKLAEIAAVQLACLIRACEDNTRISKAEEKFAVANKDLKRARRGLQALDQITQSAQTAREAVHQINDPLSVVLGNVQCLVAEKGAVNQRALSRMRRIEQASIRIAEVSRKLLEIRELDDDPRDTTDRPVTNAIC